MKQMIFKMGQHIVNKDNVKDVKCLLSNYKCSFDQKILPKRDRTVITSGMIAKQ
jgi:hypothetical protein